MFVIIATAPTAEAPVVIGPFSTREEAYEAWNEVLYLGYAAADIEPCVPLSEVGFSPSWADEDSK